MLPALSIGRQVAPALLLNAMEQLTEAQELYRETGGIHCSALSDGERILARVEDIGRHNTLDKLAGRKLREQINANPLIVLTTGRVSSEMMQKSARMGASVVVSRTSATSRSVALAQELGITLVGYARKIGFIAYTHTERLGLDAA
jgi:FdhD protein